MSRKKAIDCMCKTCIYDKYSEGTWVKQVEMCTSYDCPLFVFRPLTSAGKAERSRKNVAKTRQNGRFRSVDEQRT